MSEIWKYYIVFPILNQFPQYSICFDTRFKTFMAASLPRTFVVASSYLEHCLLLFNPYRVAKSISYKHQILNTFKKYCHFGNLLHQFIVIFQTAVNMWPMHVPVHAMTEVRHVVAMIEIVLSIHIRSLRMEWSMKNKFPYHILFPEIPTYFKITASQTLFLTRSVWTFLYMGLRAGIPSSIIFEARYWEFTCSKFSATNQSNSVKLNILI